jgi:DNA-binding protein HU-beta
MKKSALLRRVAAATGMPYSSVKRVMDATLDEIVDRLQHGERVVLSGFGTFALRPYKARTWVNPQTNRPVEIPAALRPGFITSAALKRRLVDSPLAEPAAGDGAAGDGGATPRRRSRTTGASRGARAKASSNGTPTEAARTRRARSAP